MKLLIGLGNPGEKYKNNRHNVGHMFVDYLKSLRSKVKSDMKFLKTDCFMNVSGDFVKKILKNDGVDVENLYIIHDDLDIPLGKFKIERGGGPRLHNGLKSIEDVLKTPDFWRIRVGVDARNQDNWIDGETYVLSDFTSDERDSLDDVFDQILARLDARFA